MGTYKSHYPEIEVNPALKDFFENFYKISDSPTAHQAYADCFTNDGTFIIASKKVEGTAEIIKMREGMWEKVATRAHHPLKVFPFGPNSTELMLYGTVDYTMKAGGGTTVPWAARAHMTITDGVYKMDHYQVYLDTAAMVPK